MSLPVELPLNEWHWKYKVCVCLGKCFTKLAGYQYECFSTSPAFKAIHISLLSGSVCLNKLSTERMSFVSMEML